MKLQVIVTSVVISVIVTMAVLLTGIYAFSDELRSFVTPVTVQQTSTSVVPTSTPQSVPEVVATVNPAVVSVVVTKDVPVYERYYQQYNPFGFWGGFSVPRIREQGTQEQEVGGGSGFIVSPDGLIVTNRHVVNDETARYSVLLNDGTTYDATVLARDPQLDIAILQIATDTPIALPHLQFGDSQTLRLGEPVIAIGNALAEFQNSVSTGVVSGLSRSIIASDGMGGAEQLDQVIQTDAAINPGNSGGPLLNLNGRVIGVNVATSRNDDNISFALPAHVVEQVVASVQEYGEIVRPFLGVRFTMITPMIQSRNQLPVDYGALVIRGQTPQELAVMPGSPADLAGITENTIILAIDGEKLQERDLASVLREKSINQEIEVLIYQAGEEKTVTITLEQSV